MKIERTLQEPETIPFNELCAASMETRQGGRKENQDTCILGILNQSGANNVAMACVCDGMGGARGGCLASLMASAEIDRVLREHLQEIESGNSQTIERIIKESVTAANEAVWQRSRSDESVAGMGTTGILLLATPQAAFVAQVGDSRCYQLRNGRKIFRTQDHSRVFELVKIGIMTEEQARVSSNSNIITRAIGIRSKVEVDICQLPYRRGDRFVLCCDGIWGVMPEEELLHLFSENMDNLKATSSIAQTVDEIGQHSGIEYDNLSVIVVDMKQNSKYQLSLWQQLKNSFKR